MDQAIVDAAVAKVTAPGQPYETTSERIRGVDFTVFAHAPQNLRELYREGLQHAHRDFYVFEQERYTYQDVWDHAARCANQLQARGMKPGDRVGVALRNYPEWLFTFMGITSIGAVAVALNAWWTTEEMEYGIEDSGLKLLFVDRERLERIAGSAGRLGISLVAIRSAKGGSNGSEDTGARDGIEYWEAFIEDTSSEMPGEPIQPDDNATILYTSGSTAHPKGVLSTHRSLVQALLGWECGGAIALATSTEIDVTKPEPPAEPAFDPAVILSVPLFHVSGLNVQFLASFRSGRKVVGMYKWDAEEALRIIQDERITAFNGVPTMAWELMQSPNFDKYDLSSLKSAGGGGAAMAPEHARRIDEKLGKGAPGTGWGMTETQGLATTIGGQAFLDRPKSCGRAVPPLVNVKVINDDGADAAPGETGELCIWGAMNFKEYWNKPEATAETLTDGWVHTGDIGHIDENGYVFITDREKDLIIRGGENIGCQEVEAAIYTHPAVNECAVFGVPDDRLGETVATVIMVKEGAVLSEDDVRDHTLAHLAKFKIPEHIWIQTERLPRIASEKIYKRGLRDEAIKQLEKAS